MTATTALSIPGVFMAMKSHLHILRILDLTVVASMCRESHMYGQSSRNMPEHNSSLAIIMVFCDSVQGW